MTRLFVVCLIISFYVVCKGKKEDVVACVVARTQQCIASLFLSKPLITTKGIEAVDEKTKQEFLDCVQQAVVCAKSFASARSQNQLDFCGKQEDCYDDDDDDDEDDSYTLRGCLKRLKKEIINNIAKAAFVSIGKISLITKGGMDPNGIMCSIIKLSLDSIGQLTKKECKFDISSLVLMNLSPNLVDICSLNDLRSNMV